jgi:hypothetical protein
VKKEESIMPVNVTIDDWKTIYVALYDELETFNEDNNGVFYSLNVKAVDNEDTRRIRPTLEKVEQLLTAQGVDV